MPLLSSSLTLSDSLWMAMSANSSVIMMMMMMMTIMMMVVMIMMRKKRVFDSSAVGQYRFTLGNKVQFSFFPHSKQKHC